MRIGFTGTRRGMTERQRNTLSCLLADLNWFSFHHGGCEGADTQADAIAQTVHGKNRICIRPGDEEQYLYWLKRDRPNVFSPKPYLERNKRIAEGADILIAAPKSMKEEVRSGTWATVRYARKVGKPIVILDP